MKRRRFFAGILLLSLLAGGASVWEGSAVVGGAGDFPGDGLFGACNSFPRDASVEVKNLENGKTITVVITRNVENPGVFIALSPKAASELGMRQGSAARVRAVALSLSMTEASLPAARAGETADPDFNPKIYVERDKAIAQGRTASEQATKASAPVSAPAQPAAQAVAAAPTAAPAAAPAAETAAAIIAEASTSPAAIAPSEKTEEGTSGTSIESDIPEVEKVPADPYPLPALAAAKPGEPRPESVGVALPTPDPAPIPSAEERPSARTFPASVPEAIGGSLPRPRVSTSLRAYLPDPLVAERTAASEIANEPGTDSGLSPSVEGGERPLVPESERIAQLDEPALEFRPDELPEELLPRLAGPAPTIPEIALAEIDMSGIAVAAGDENVQPEAIAIERPAGRETAVSEAGLEEPEALVAESAEAQTGPEAMVAERPDSIIVAEDELADPTTPSPTESLAVERPEGLGGEVAETGLEEPSATTLAPDGGPTAVAVETPDREASAEAELGIPATPEPSESLAVERPEEGPYAAEAGGEIAVDLEPTTPRPPAAVASAESAMGEIPTAAAETRQAAPTPEAIAVAKIQGKPAEQPPSVPLLESLSRGFFYVQIGVYGSNDSLLGAVNGFRSTYPLAVEKVSAKEGSYAYRLYVGPLTRDESGLVLFKIKSMGYRDAFVKQGT